MKNGKAATSFPLFLLPENFEKNHPIPTKDVDVEQKCSILVESETSDGKNRIPI